MGKPRAFTDEQERSEIAPKYEAGALLCDLAEEYGVSTTAIARALDRVGITRRKAAPRPGIPRPRPGSRLFNDEQAAELASRYRTGAFVAELAEETGVSRKAVNNALRRQGVPLRDKQQSQAHLNVRRRARGERNPNFKGGRMITGEGYVLVGIDATDPLWLMATKRGAKDYVGYIGTGYVLEHRLVMARHLDRPLESHETVHHKNGDRADNREENLELRVGKHGKGASEAHCPTCSCFKVALDLIEG